jgi:hypothetical protein
MRFPYLWFLGLSLALLAGPGSSQVTPCGDCNLDGTVTILDALTSAQFAAGVGVPTGPQVCLCDPNSDASVTVLDALLMAQAAAGLVITLTCPPGCTNHSPVLDVTAPVGGIHQALITIAFDLTDVDLDLQTITCDFSTDGGLTWTLATSAGTGVVTANPESGVVPALGLDFDWLSQADLPPGSVTVDFRVATDDGQGGTAADTTVFDVTTTVPPPYCVATTPSPGVPSNEIPIDYSAVDATSTPVDLIVEFSDDGGLTWEQCSEALSGSHGTIGLPASPVPGTPHVFIWRSRFDGMGLTGPQTCTVQITVQNPNGWSICATAPFVVDNP